MATPAAAAPHPTVAALYVYPVKSCGGVRVGAARFTRHGLQHDRRWCIVDQDGDVQCQYMAFPKLATIRCAFDVDDDSNDDAAGGASGGVLVLAADGMPAPLRVPIRTAADPTRRIGTPVEIMRTQLQDAEDEGAESSAWLTRYLATGDRAEDTFRLIWCPPDRARPLCKDPKWGRLMTRTERTGFADTAQLHIVSLASLRALNEALRENGTMPVGVENFRPNLVVGGGADGELIPWDEDFWRLIQLGASSILRVCMLDVRCAVTTITQTGLDAGQRDMAREPLATLQRLRPARLFGGEPCGIFGTKLMQIGAPGSVIVGDTLQVLERTDATLRSCDMEQMRNALHVAAAGGGGGRL